MLALLWLIPLLPLLGFLLLTLAGTRLSHRLAGGIAVGAIGLAALVTLLVAWSFLVTPPPASMYRQSLWVWMQVGNFTPEVAFYLDALSLTMLLVVTIIGFMIHLYATEFMRTEEGYQRFFAYMNLFVSAMLTLVLADNLLLLYLGWEGVGLCSYLLIGFWYHDPANGRAARKAFLITRIGDTAMAIGLFLLFSTLGTLAIQPLLQSASQTWVVGSAMANTTAALLLIGALGKSAQLPLHTWLPDAMAGPTPVSALIHAATMVTAGVYLLARLHGLFTLAPAVQATVAVIGALTLLVAASSALVQRDIKRVLAYSTMSQVGYMFLALGVGAWSAAIFHLAIHACFKALLFLAAGAVILSQHHEHDMFRMGGLWRHLPIPFVTFLIGSASLAGVPLVTAGFYSKDLILWQVWTSASSSSWLWLAGIVGAFLTAIYIFRAVFLVFFGRLTTPVDHRPAWRIHLVLLLLACLSIIAGWLEIPATVGYLLPVLPEGWRHLTFVSDLLHTALPAMPGAHADILTELNLQIIASVVALAGIGGAAVLFVLHQFNGVRASPSSWQYRVHHWLATGWGFDWLYNRSIVQPFTWLTQRHDVFEVPYRGLLWLIQWGHDRLRQTQTGRVRWYAASLTGSAVLVIALVVFL